MTLLLVPYIGRETEAKYEVVECKIEQKILGFPVANLALSRSSDLKCGEYYAIMDDDRRVFVGRIESIKNMRNIKLIAIPDDSDEQIKQLKQIHGQKLIDKVQRSDLVTWSTTELRGRDIFDTEATIEISADSVTGMDFRFIAQKTAKFEVTVRWGRDTYETIDLGEHIFREGPIATITPDSLLNAWPTAGSEHYDFYVVSSSLEPHRKSQASLSDGQLVERASFTGGLILQRLCEYKFDETWLLDLKTEGDKTIELQLDLEKYVERYPKWTGGTFYTKGTRVMHNGIIVVAKLDHASNDYYDSHWEASDSVGFGETGNVLLSSEIGKEILRDLGRSISAYMLIHETPILLELTSTWEMWKEVQTYNLVHVTYQGTEYVLRVMECIKMLKYSSKYVKLKCRGYCKPMKHGEANLCFGEGTLKEAGLVASTGFIDAQVLNQADAQIENYPNMQPTKVRYSTKHRKRKYRVNLDVEVGWNLG